MPERGAGHLIASNSSYHIQFRGSYEALLTSLVHARTPFRSANFLFELPRAALRLPWAGVSHLGYAATIFFTIYRVNFEPKSTLVDLIL